MYDRKPLTANRTTPYARRTTQYDNIIEFCLIFLIVFTPLSYGSVHPWGIAIFELTAALMAVIWFFKMLRSGTLEFIRIPFNGFIFLFIFYISLQFLTRRFLPTTYYLLPTTIYSWGTKTELLKIISYALIFLATLNTIKTRRQITRILSAIIAVGFFMSIFYLMRYFGAKAPQGIINSDHFSGYLGMIIPIGLGFLFVPSLSTIRYAAKGLSPKRSEGDCPLITLYSNRFLLFFTIITMSAALFFTMSRGGMFSFIAALLFMAGLTLTRKSIKKKGWILSAVAIFIILTIAWLGATPVVERILSVKAEITSLYFGGRFPIWQGTLKLIKDYPIFGTGLGTFNYIFPKYQPAPIIAKHYTYAHNDILELFSETGIAGIILVACCVLFVVIYLFRRFNIRHDPWVVGMSIGLFGSLASIFIHSFVDFNLHIPPNAILLTLILALTLIISNLKRDKFGERAAFSKIYFRMPKIPLYPVTMIVFGFYIFISLRPALADYYFRNTQGDAIRNIQYAIKLDPANAQYHYELGRLYSRAATDDVSNGPLFPNLEVALAEYQKAVQLNPANSKYHQSLAWAYGILADLCAKRHTLNAQNYERKAIEEFELAISLEPNNPYRHSVFAIWLFNHPTEENIERVAAEYRKMINLNPAWSNEILNSYYELTKNYDLLREIISDTAEGHFTLKEYFVKKGVEGRILREQEEIILSRLNSEIAYAEDKRAVYERAGRIYYGLGKFSESIEAHHKAIEFGSEDTWTYYWLAESYRKAQNPDLAIKYYQLSSQLDRNNSWSYFSLARLYQSIGKKAKAEAMWQKILELENPSPEVEQIAKTEIKKSQLNQTKDKWP